MPQPQGPHGRPGAGMPFWPFGRGSMPWGPGFKIPGPIPRAPGGTVVSDASPSAKSAKASVDFYCNKKIVAIHTGSKLKGFISASRMNVMGPLHYNVYLSRIAAADKDYAEKRITEEQCKYRKLKAADKYHSYLFNLGLYTEQQYEYEVETYAREIGVGEDEQYIVDQVFDESKTTRHR